MRTRQRAPAAAPASRLPAGSAGRSGPLLGSAPLTADLRTDLSGGGRVASDGRKPDGPHRPCVVTVRLSYAEVAQLDVIREQYSEASRAWVLRQGLALVMARVEAGESIRPHD